MKTVWIPGKNVGESSEMPRALTENQCSRGYHLLIHCSSLHGVLYPTLCSLTPLCIRLISLPIFLYHTRLAKPQPWLGAILPYITTVSVQIKAGGNSHSPLDLSYFAPWTSWGFSVLAGNDTMCHKLLSVYRPYSSLTPSLPNLFPYAHSQWPPVFLKKASIQKRTSPDS